MDSPGIDRPLPHALRILHLEDEPDSTRLLQWKLNIDGVFCELYRVDNRADFVSALENGGFDLVLSDYCVPTFDGATALAIAREKSPDLPFIFVTGAFNEDTGGNLLKAGATDYVIKTHLSKLAQAVLRAMREAAAQRRRARAESQLAAIQDNCLLMASTVDVTEIFPSILAKIDILLPAAACSIGVLDNISGKVQPGACRRLDEAPWRAEVEKTGDSLESAIVKSQQLRVVRNFHDEDDLLASRFYPRNGFISCLGAPLTARGETVGALVVLSRDKHDFTEEEIVFVKTLAVQAGLAVANARLYSDNRQLAQELSSSKRQVSRLVAGLLNAHDEEAKRISSVLHDESQQLLASVYISLDEIAKRAPVEAVVQLEQAKTLLDQVEDRLRNLSHELYPTILDDLGLLPSLEFLAGQVAKRKGIKITVESHLSGRLPPLLDLTLYRVVQEALNNTSRHARASQADIRLFANPKWIHCSIRDNGVGFDVGTITKNGAATGAALGLNGMRERIAAVHGTLQVLSAPGSGTEILIGIPHPEMRF